MKQVATIETGLLNTSYPDITRASLDMEVERMVEAVNAGEVDPIKAIAFLNGIDKVIKDVRTLIMEQAVDEFAKYNEKEITVLEGCKVSQVEAGVRYDYSKTAKWNELKVKEDMIANERKALEKTLQTLKGRVPMVDENTGEVSDLIPPIRTSTTTLKIIIK